MFVQHLTPYKDVPHWGLSDSFWERIQPFIPKPSSIARTRQVPQTQWRTSGCRATSRDGRYSYVLCMGGQWNAVPRE
jgi:hypothetical protein